jgi:hypothetical protein
MWQHRSSDNWNQIDEMEWNKFSLIRTEISLQDYNDDTNNFYAYK